MGRSGNRPGWQPRVRITTSNQYNKRLQPTVLSAQAPSQTVLSLSYDFHLGVNDNGNVYAILNNRDATRSAAYSYDPLNRIATAETSESALWGQSFGYDAWGNLLTQTVTQGTAPPLNVTVNGKNQITNTGFCYDAAGNLLGQTNCSTYVYDAENRLKQTAGVTYTYDGDGKRVSKSTGKLYWTGMGSDPLDESDAAGAINEEYVFFGGKRIARLDLPSATVHYYFSDHLGSADVVTSASGVIEQESDYYPFGGERAITSGPNNYKFTGKERDGESGLDEFGARYYSSALGRFTIPDWSDSPDPIPYAELADPQTLDLYSYVRNNPTTYLDPTGHDCPTCPDIDLDTVSKLIDEGTEAGKELIKAAPSLGATAAAGAAVVGAFYWADTSITDAYVANKNDQTSLSAQAGGPRLAACTRP